MFTYRKLTSVFTSLIVIFSLAFSGFQSVSVSAQTGGDGKQNQVYAQKPLFNLVDMARTNRRSAGKLNLYQDPNLTETPIPTETTLATDTPVPTETALPTATPIPTDLSASTTNTIADGVVALAATTWYVTTTGSNSNSCSNAGNPCATIQGAIDKAASGDIINIAIGTYTDIGSDVVRIWAKSLVLSGGWDVSFSTQNGMSTIDGQGVRYGITTAGYFSGMAVSVERLIVKNGTRGIFAASVWTINNSVITR